MTTLANLLSKQKVSISTEMISPQYNDYVVHLLVKQFNLLIDTCVSNSLFGQNIYRSKLSITIINEIDSILFKRFGIKFEHIYGKNSGYAVMSVPPKKFNVLKDDIEENYDIIKRLLKDDTTEHKKDINKKLNFEKDVNIVMKSWVKSVDLLEKQLNAKEVTINLSKATIEKLPEDYLVYLLSDFSVLIHDCKLSARELTAVLLHEVGHEYTHMEYSLRTVRNTAVLVDTINAELKDDVSFKEAIDITYRKVYDGKDDSNNTITGVLRLLDTYVKSTFIMGENTHSKTDSEQLADQFAGRFQLGMELTTAVGKLNAYNIKLTNDMTYIMLYSQLMYMTIFSLILYGSLFMGGALLLGGIVIGLVLTLVFDLLGGLITSGGMIYGMTYDYDKQRFIRIRNEIVRQLRTSNLPKEVIVERLSDIRRIDDLIALAPDEKDKESSLTMYLRGMLPGAKALVETKLLDQLTENLLENDLHIASNKLKTL